MENYIMIMIRSLEKKMAVLQRIEEENRQQEQVLLEDELDIDVFQETVEQKSKLVDELDILDEGFETMYERVKTVLDSDREKHTEDIRAMQKVITQITEMSVNIQKAEARNRRLAEKQFSSLHQKVRQVKASSKIANHYYKSMSNLNNVQPQFMDKKN